LHSRRAHGSCVRRLCNISILLSTYYIAKAGPRLGVAALSPNFATTRLNPITPSHPVIYSYSHYLVYFNSGGVNTMPLFCNFAIVWE
jgi:hypothetical protein